VKEMLISDPHRRKSASELMSMGAAIAWRDILNMSVAAENLPAPLSKDYMLPFFTCLRSSVPSLLQERALIYLHKYSDCEISREVFVSLSAFSDCFLLAIRDKTATLHIDDLIASSISIAPQSTDSTVFNPQFSSLQSHDGDVSDQRNVLATKLCCIYLTHPITSYYCAQQLLSSPLLPAFIEMISSKFKWHDIHRALLSSALSLSSLASTLRDAGIEYFIMKNFQSSIRETKLKAALLLSRSHTLLDSLNVELLRYTPLHPILLTCQIYFYRTCESSRNLPSAHVAPLSQLLFIHNE